MQSPPTLEYSSRPQYRRGLHVYACCVAAATLLLIAAGGMVTSTGSGLAVPDWPTTYGYNMFTYPVSKWQGGIFFEHSHRLIASTVGMLTIGLAVWLQRCDSRRWMRRLGWIALVAVICQGILGGLTVRYLLPTPISVFHACLAQAFLGLLTAIAVFTSRGWMQRVHRMETSARWPIPAMSILLIGVIFAQLIAGAVMRHTRSGLAVPDFPLAYDRIIPHFDAASIASYNESRVWDHALPAVTAGQIAYHMVHRGGAIAVSLVLLICATLVLLRHREIAGLRRPAMLSMILLGVQLFLGAWTVLSGKVPAIATAHVAVGAGMLAACVVLALRAHQLLVVRSVRTIPAASLAGVCQ